MKIMTGVILLAIAMIAISSRLLAQQPSCLHGPNESDAQRTRKRAALIVARTLNTLENTAFQSAGSYRAVAELPAGLTSILEGFQLHAAIEPQNYVFAIKDMMDPCGFAYFSDESGVIYTGEAIR